jgi:biopolymer transport protein TolR
MQASGGGGNGGAQQAAATYRTLRSRHAGAVMGDINVTPLVDVVLVLLLVFMVTAPMMSRGIDMSLPVADQPQTTPEDRITVSINAQERIYIGDQPVARPLLITQLKGRLDAMASKVVYLRADEGLRYGRVIEVVDAIRQAGADQIGFVYVLPSEKAAERRAEGR